MARTPLQRLVDYVSKIKEVLEMAFNSGMRKRWRGRYDRARRAYDKWEPRARRGYRTAKKAYRYYRRYYRGR